MVTIERDTHQARGTHLVAGPRGGQAALQGVHGGEQAQLRGQRPRMIIGTRVPAGGDQHPAPPYTTKHVISGAPSYVFLLQVKW